MVKEKESKKRPETEMTLRERLLRDLSGSSDDIPKREISVMTRLGSEVVEILDALVKLDFFKSRSEAAAAIIEQKILSNLELFKSIKEQAKKIEGLQEELEDLTLKTLRE